MLSAITPFINLAVSVLQLVATHEAMSLINELKDLEMDLQKELSKGYESDDAKIENLYDKIKIVGQAVQEQFALYAGKGNPGVIPGSSAPSISPPASD